MNYDEESYNSAVNLQWEKLANAQTNEEIQSVLDTWPDKKSFEVEAQSDEVDSELVSLVKEQNEG